MKLRRHRIILALLFALTVVAGVACKAATLGQTAVECSSLNPGIAKATFNWTPGVLDGTVQYLDVSMSDNGFAPGTYTSVGPFAGDAQTFVSDNVTPGAAHWFRVNTFDGSNWWTSTTGYFMTPFCSAPPTSAPPTDGGGGCIESSIRGTFEGWNGDTLFPLTNGQFWLQASYSYTYHYAYSPRVSICPVNGGYEMYVEGVSRTILATPVSCTESCIAGLFEGWDFDTIFNLCNGQTWQQASISLLLHLALNPSVFICEVGGGHKMWVEGVDESIYVERLR